MRALEGWKRIQLRLQGMPGGTSLCERINAASATKSDGPLVRIMDALVYCTHFPTEEFRALLLVGDLDVRWPLTFAAFYLISSGATVDQLCVAFLVSAGLWEKAQEALSEYDAPGWLLEWREQIKRARGQEPKP